jgi:hypothetical protein
VVKGKKKTYLSSLQIAGRHFARFHIALQIKAELLTFDDVAHSGALNGRDMNKGVSAAIVRLNEAKALC